MFIELTDHLRCPQPHEESYLVLLPHRMEGRRVMAGHLGCPSCGWSTNWDGGDPVFGPTDFSSEGAPPFDAAALLALLGVEGPGGWLALAGRACWLGESLAQQLPDVGVAAINPPEGVPWCEPVSTIVSPAWPIKSHALRGVVVGIDAAEFNDSAIGSVLPGLRIVGESLPPAEAGGYTLLQAVEGLWVVRRS